MADPRRLFEARDVAAACLYAKRLASAEDGFAVLANTDGSLIVNVTSGTVSLSSTAVTASLSNSGVTISLNRSLSSSSGTLSATTGTVLIAGSGKSKVYGFSLTTTSTTGVICSFHAGGIAGTELWRVLLQAPSGANAGANLAIS